MSVAKLTSKGRVTLPRDIREALDLKAGDPVAFTLLPDGTVILQRASLSRLFGRLKPAKHGVSLEDMEEAIALGACE